MQKSSLLKYEATTQKNRKSHWQMQDDDDDDVLDVRRFISLFGFVIFSDAM